MNNGMKKYFIILLFVFLSMRPNFAKNITSISNLLASTGNDLKSVVAVSNQNSIQNNTMTTEYTIVKSITYRTKSYSTKDEHYRWFYIISTGDRYLLAEKLLGGDIKTILNSQYQDIKTLNEYDVYGNAGCSYFKVLKNGKWAVYSIKQNAFITDFQYDKIEDVIDKQGSHYSDNEVNVRVYKSNRCAILFGNSLSDYYDDILPIDGYYGVDLVKIRKNDKWGVYANGMTIHNGHLYKNQVLTDIIYDDIKYQRSESSFINDYTIHTIKGLKNGQWKTIVKQKFMSDSLLNKALSNILNFKH